MSTHPKYSQDLYQNYASMHWYQEEWGYILDWTAECQSKRGEDPILSKTSILQHQKRIAPRYQLVLITRRYQLAYNNNLHYQPSCHNMWYPVTISSSNNLVTSCPEFLPRLPARKRSQASISVVVACFIKYPVKVVRESRYNSKRPVTVDTAIRIDQSSLQGCTT